MTDQPDPTPRHRVAVFAPYFPPAVNGGGPIRSIDALVSLAPAEFTTSVLTRVRDLGARTPLPVRQDQWGAYGRAEVRYFAKNSPRSVFGALTSLRSRAPELVHVNSLFDPVFSILPAVLWRCGWFGKSRFLLSPRGELGEAALARRTPKKRAYLAVFKLLGLPARVCWHSTARHETEAIRQMFGNHITVLEREVDTLLPTESRPPAPYDGPPRLAFLGRVVAHKGLVIALEALRDLTGPAILDIYGSEEDADYVAACRKASATLPDTITIQFRGVLPPDQVLPTLQDYDALVMPTAGENFGHVIAEALAASCHVLTTDATPWTETLARSGGEIIERNTEAWSAALTRYAALSPSERHQLRVEAGRSFDDWKNRPQEPHLWELACQL